MTNAVKKPREVEAPPPEFTRFILPDMSERGEWLLARLKTKYTHLNDGMLFGWLRGLIDSPEVLFLKTPNSVGMAQIVRESISPAPTIVERFVLARGSNAVEASWHYARMEQWAEALGAQELVVDVFTDVPRSMIQERVGRQLRIREQMYARLK